MSKYEQFLDRLVKVSVDNVILTKELENLMLQSASFEQSNINYSVTVRMLEADIEELKKQNP